MKVPVTCTGTGTCGTVAVMSTSTHFWQVPVTGTGTSTFSQLLVTGTDGLIPAPAPEHTYLAKAGTGDSGYGYELISIF